MDNRIYLSLDFPSWVETRNFLDEHALQGVPVKVGMELFYREGPKVIEKLKENDHAIFLDLKLHDIPTTVMKAMKNIAKLDVDMVNVHALGGSEMIMRAKEGLLSGADHNLKTKLIAVTILTSHTNELMNKELLIQGNLQDNVVHFAEFANHYGADGVVCSVHEAKQIKEVCGSSFLTVTPGIRLKESSVDDQERVATPAFARKNGSDILVVGRSVTQSKDPYIAYETVKKEWAYGVNE
ncbi:orotidine-5'-phosphate decarboxylase [Virgibacillus byunsanensis]|uniref:Orotidine 5'-phosphate decarboxylase n=1 Tax=Virgibacillus byunsanensis TaxID=570945 RepID=A0ABW3LL81_9BACI